MASLTVDAAQERRPVEGGATGPGGWVIRAAVLVALVGLAVSVPIHAAYISNQNQYLLPVVGPTVEALAPDWMLTTVDPYPFFTSFSSLLYSLLGKTGFAIAAFVAALGAWFALYLLSRSLLGGNRIGAVLATVLVGVSQLLPLVPNMFGGLANQYILEQPMFYQPAAAGSLVLIGAAIALRARLGGAAIRPAAVVVAVTATALGCALHPTYLVVAALLLFAALLVDLATGRRSLRVLAGYAALVAAFAAVTFALNPAMLDIAGADPALNERFAFERIPHHTLLSQWGVWTWRYALVVAVAGVLWWRSQRWFAAWLLTGIGLAVGLAAVVEATGSATLALAFPARASVILVPLAFVAVTSFAVRLIGGRTMRAKWIAVAAALAAVALGTLGLRETVALQTDPAVDEATALVAAAAPAGIGYVPLEAADNVRLNAGAALFVDRKSPPYASGDLAEWFRRVDAAESAAQSPAAMCSLIADEGLTWAVLPAEGQVPGCLADWQAVGESDRYRMLAVGR